MDRIGDTLLHFDANKEIVQKFASVGVEFVVIGGLAMAWYWDDRQADDMDILVNPTNENSARISLALSGLQLNDFNEDSFTKLGLRIPLKQTYYADLLTPQKDGPTFSEAASDAVDAKLFHIPVLLASPLLLIRMKEKAVASTDAGREKHLKDIEWLKEHAI